MGSEYRLNFFFFIASCSKSIYYDILSVAFESKSAVQAAESVIPAVECAAQAVECAIQAVASETSVAASATGDFPCGIWVAASASASLYLEHRRRKLPLVTFHLEHRRPYM